MFGATSGCTHVARCWYVSEQRVGQPAVVPTERCDQNTQKRAVNFDFWWFKLIISAPYCPNFHSCVPTFVTCSQQMMASVTQAIVNAVTGLERMCRNCAYCFTGGRWDSVTCGREWA